MPKNQVALVTEVPAVKDSRTDGLTLDYKDELQLKAIKDERKQLLT